MKACSSIPWAAMDKRTYAAALAASAVILLVGYDAGLAQQFPNSVFVASKKWFRLEGDDKRDVFRGYAGLVTSSGEDGLVDFPNLFVLHCAPDNVPFLTLHFPQGYEFRGFTADAWIPKTEVHVRTESGTFRFDAELNQNEFHIDLDENSFKNLRDIWNSNGRIDLKIGPSAEDVRFVFGDQGIDASTRDIVNREKRIVREHFIESVIPLCLARHMESPRGRQWIVWGAVWCTACSGSDGDTFAYVKIDKRGRGIRTERECLKVKRDYENGLEESAVNQPKVMSELLCLRVETP